VNKALLKSLLTTNNPFNSTDEVVAWIERRNREVEVRVEEVPFADLKGWHFEGETGNLVHDSGKFFSIVGIDVRTNTGYEQRWTQPIINQPEVGYLGIICKEFDGVLYFLLQAKIEPGNVNCVQLSPTLQATRSNYTQVHGGKKPAYLGCFQNAKPDQIILDQLQSEQGSRFLRKRNRNIIIRVDNDIVVGEDFCWLTLGQIKALLRRDNTVNMDTRTVLSGLRLEGKEEGSASFATDLFASERAKAGVMTLDEILHRLSELKLRYELVVEKMPLKDVTDWTVTSMEIVHKDRKYFRVLGVNVTIENREVAKWCQPIVQPLQEGLCVLFAKKIKGVLHFLLQAKVECGNFDVVEFAPTIQCLTGDFRKVAKPPTFVREFLDGSIRGRMLFDTKQSEEGGRFYHEQNRNVVMLLDENVELADRDNFIWLTLGQIKEFLRFNNYLNIQVRSLIASLQYV
jgi:oxidase EvaA